MALLPLQVVKSSRFVGPLAVAAAVAMVVISEGAYWQSVQAMDNLVAIGDARGDILRMQQSVLAAEAGQRNFLRNHRPTDLALHDAAVKDIGDALQRLDRYGTTNAHTQAGIADLNTLLNAQRTAWARAIDLDGTEATQNPTTTPTTTLAPPTLTALALLEAIQAHGTQLLAAQAHAAQASRQTLHDKLRGRRVGMALLTALCLLALGLFLRRTQELKQQEQRLTDSVQAERDRLEIEVAQRTAQLTELARHLQTAREDERNRLARNLHDELGSLLTSAKLDAARIRSRLAGKAPEALERLGHLVQTLNQSIALGRSIIEDLRPSTLDNLGLVPTLDILAREFAAQSGIAVECALSPVPLNPGAELMVYRLVQEAITNISKYAHARHVWIGLDTRNGRVEVSVRDDGVGFDTAAPAKSAFGLLGMRFRVEAEGGQLTLVSAPGQGTKVWVTLPAAPDQAAATATVFPAS